MFNLDTTYLSRQTAFQSLWRLAASDLGRCELARGVLPRQKGGILI
ncbi:MAG: hypothetical protein HYT15_04600 [Candidatus Magasanikbacteria bacterium]|nr:hypothetical protein [Candidatus Magasanikbacteria bacterium]